MPHQHRVTQGREMLVWRFQAAQRSASFCAELHLNLKVLQCCRGLPLTYCDCSIMDTTWGVGVNLWLPFDCIVSASDLGLSRTSGWRTTFEDFGDLFLKKIKTVVKIHVWDTLRIWVDLDYAACIVLNVFGWSIFQPTSFQRLNPLGTGVKPK